MTSASSGADALTVSTTTLPLTSPTSTFAPWRWRPSTASTARRTVARASASGASIRTGTLAVTILRGSRIVRFTIAVFVSCVFGT
jgi:hypothetical protein